jgi:hypothetical protein
LGTKNQSSKSLLSFHTGLLVSDYPRFPAFPYRGKNWLLDLAEVPAKWSFGSTQIDGVTYESKEVIVRARTKDQAQRAADLIHAVRLTLYGDTVLSHIFPGDHALIQLVNENEGRPTYPRVETLNIPLACLIATRASFRLQYVYALAKLRLSFEAFSLPAMDLDPGRNDNIRKSNLPDDHVRFSFAIISAWACIEELGFEIRASRDKPSRLPDGTWNTVVRNDLEGRLRKGHIDLKELFAWNLRGPRTRLEMKRAPSILKLSPWARHRVRDGDMEVVDALSYVHFLRSSVSAHRSDKSLVKLLSVYDVANAQFLARRLLLEKMGFRKYWNGN